MLKFCLATSLKVLHASVRCKSCWIPKSNWGLHSEFILEGTQRRSCVVGPVTPGASSQAILPQMLNLIRKNHIHQRAKGIPARQRFGLLKFFVMATRTWQNFFLARTLRSISHYSMSLYPKQAACKRLAA